MTDTRSVARAIDALRRGWPVRIGATRLLSVETMDDARLAAFDPAGDAAILLSDARAATLKLGNQPDAAGAIAVTVARTPWLDMTGVRALADPATDLAHPLQGPFRTVPTAAPADAAAALTLARHAGLLPAFFIGTGEGADDTATDAVSVAAYDAPATLKLVARARLPVAVADDAEIAAFRGPDAAAEHVALIVGTPGAAPPLVRLHSECLTGDVLGSLKCDCGPQLHAALERIAQAEWGILIYLRQEGRGIGLINKLRAYELQDQGFDTVDANLRLGFAVDSRDFGVAARMLALLGAPRVRLLTNNPAKVAGLVANGIEVVERVGHALPANPHNAHYLDTKRDRTGHQL